MALRDKRMTIRRTTQPQNMVPGRHNERPGSECALEFYGRQELSIQTVDEQRVPGFNINRCDLVRAINTGAIQGYNLVR